MANLGLVLFFCDVLSACDDGGRPEEHLAAGRHLITY